MVAQCRAYSEIHIILLRSSQQIQTADYGNMVFEKVGFASETGMSMLFDYGFGAVCSISFLMIFPPFITNWTR